MADTKEKNAFKPGLYAVVAGIVIAVFLVVATIFAFTTRYTAFSPEKVAVAYTDTIVQTGDGYNAYKNTLVSKNQKYGNFVINAYMAPYVNKDAEKNAVIGTGTEEETQLLDTVYSTMYDYYVELLSTYGLDDYDSVFSKYFEKLSEVRKTVIGDEYMDTDFMFGVFESNVDTYGKSLTGTQQEIANDGKTVIQEASTGVYQEMFGEDYRFTASVAETKELTADEVKAYADEYKARITPVVDGAEAKADSFGLGDTTKEKKILFFTKKEESKPKSNMISAYEKLDCSESISAVDVCTVEIKLDDGTVVASYDVYVVQIGNSWYVDNTNTTTSSLYLAK